MGGVSSVNVDTNRGHSPPNESNLDQIETETDSSLTEQRKNLTLCQNAINSQLNHSVTENTSSQNAAEQINCIGITEKYLVEENCRLLLENKRMASVIERLTENHDCTSLCHAEDPDYIHGESLEERLTRLEKHLASERREKWSAIENSEKARVDLVNCERDLTISIQKADKLAEELEKSQQCIKDLKESLEKLKKDGKEGETSEESTSMKRFREDLKAKRETRQRALSAISMEMNSLREELQKDKSTIRKLEKELEVRKAENEDPSLEALMSDNSNLRNEINILTENLEKLQNSSSENIRLKFEVKRLNEEMDSMTLNMGELKFEYYEEKRKHERTMKRLKELEEKKESSEPQSCWEEEKEKFFEKYDQEKEEIAKRTNALKEVIEITRQMLNIRESQVQELKAKLKDIEESVKKSKIMEEDGLKAEFEKQIQNIKKLKELYEERVRLIEGEKQKLSDTLQEKVKIIEDQDKEIKSLVNQNESYRQEAKYELQEKESMDRELRLMVARCKDLENEIRLMNNMFTQMLLGPFNSGQETDLDKLTELLQENHDLITEMTTKEDGSEIASVLPKLLLDLITQVDGLNDRKDYDQPESSDTISEQSESMLEGNKGAVLPILSYKNATLFKHVPVDIESIEADAELSEESKAEEYINPAVQEIASNLPKVWKVLTELLSHHTAPEEPTPSDERQCYKNIDTPNGPRTVISVSKTFIRLKDLILEKKGLQKELTRLKQLNSHLETRLDDQEKRLSQVQCELHKTWGIVGRMRAQHQQLHNQEKILRYELQEKRVMLNELKQELEYCRDKWESARKKNDESETEWKKLRREFAARKTKVYIKSSLNDSGESGFSDEQNESGEDFDADRSTTQSPIDRKLISSKPESQPGSPLSTLVEVKTVQLEANVREADVVEIVLEECQDYTPSSPTSSSAPNHILPDASNVGTESVKSVKTETTEECATSASVAEEERQKARDAREQRLKRLEEQCKLLVRQVDITTHKSNFLNDRLGELHEQYGSSEDGREEASTSTSSNINPSENTSLHVKEETVATPDEDSNNDSKEKSGK